LLKKENRVLKEEHQKMMNTLKKYHVERVDQPVNTDPEKEEEKTLSIQLEQAVQVDLDIPQNNTSKLSSAYDLLKQLNVSSQSLCSRCEEQLINTTQCEFKESRESRETKRTTTPSSSQQISNEIVKLAKEIATLKR
jgi:hypothetical protein